MTPKILKEIGYVFEAPSSQHPEGCWRHPKIHLVADVVAIRHSRETLGSLVLKFYEDAENTEDAYRRAAIGALENAERVLAAAKEQLR